MSISNLAKVDAHNIPAHVPDNLVVPYDLLRVAAPGEDPFEVLNYFRKYSPVFYSPVHFSSSQGAWVLTQAADIRAVLQDPKRFSSRNISGFSALLGEMMPLIPLELDPPVHEKFRILLNPLFAPNRIAALLDDVRATCVGLIDTIARTEKSEFVADFARQFPVKVILQLMGLPLKDFDLFMKWEGDLLHAPDIDLRISAAKDIARYLRAAIDDRKRLPKDDFIGYAVKARIDGVPIKDEEILGICYLLFVGGLDTVTSSLGFFFKYLAEHPDQQRRLRDDPRLIPDAVEELLRVHALVLTSRFVTQDTEVAGVQMRAGDCIAIYTSFASMDETETESPEIVDFDRQDKRHITFSYGPHRCIGSHLARRELAIAIEEWLSRIPEFRLASEDALEMHGGIVFGVDRLNLVWDLFAH